MIEMDNDKLKFNYRGYKVIIELNNIEDEDSFVIYKFRIRLVAMKEKMKLIRRYHNIMNTISPRAGGWTGPYFSNFRTGESILEFIYKYRYLRVRELTGRLIEIDEEKIISPIMINIKDDITKVLDKLIPNSIKFLEE